MKATNHTKAALLAAALLALAGFAHAADVGVSINIGQPGFYGRIDIGDYPQPQLIYREPVLVQRAPRYVESAPIYLRVPPGHAKNWSKHCHKYHACNQRVYFVQDRWYNDVYAPRYRERHGEHRPPHAAGPRPGHDHGPGRGHDRNHHRDEHRGPGQGHDRGPGNGNGHGRDH